MKIKITELENRLGKKIKRNFSSVGFDTARITGIACITTNKEIATIDWQFIDFDSSNEKVMFKQMYKAFGEILNKQDLAVIEQVFLGFNVAGALHLARLGTLAMAQCFNKDIDYELLSAVSARGFFKINTRKYGKGKSKEAVKDWLISVGLDVDENNVEDALVLALNGICEK